MANDGLLHRVSAPIANAWRSLLHRFSRSSCRGTRSFAKLYNDVQSCTYEDVHVMWSIIHQQMKPIQVSSGKAIQMYGNGGVNAGT